MLLSMAIAAQVVGAGTLAPWTTDFSMQPLARRPHLEARYEDATRRALVIEGETYRMVVDLRSPKGQRIRSLAIGRAGKQIEALSPLGATVGVTGGDGRVYDSAHSTTASRVNLYRRGPYYIEVRWLDVSLTSTDGAVAPLRGDIALYAYPDKVYCQAILHVTAPASYADVRATTGCPWTASTAGGDRAVVRRGPSRAVAIMSTTARLKPDATETTATATLDATRTWAKGDKITHCWAWLPLPDLRAASARLAEEMSPLPSSAFSVTKGGAMAWDPIRGCYTIGTHNDGGFQEHFYDHPNGYETARFTVANDGRARRITVCHETSTGQKGSVECGVLQDERGDALPILVQISKNFAGEIEERFYNPTDAPFSETYFPLYLAPKEIRTLTSHHLYQNWGNHPLKQFSSLGAWMDYYHMSTGVTETTCYVPFKFDGLHGVQIADMRPFSQRFWADQPQHDNVAGHTFLRYLEDGKMRDMEYTGTLFRSTGPNWADMSLLFRSEDGKVEGRMDCFELPQTDELRNFCRLRFDVKAPVKLADASTDFRLLSIRSYVQALRYQKAAWSIGGGEPGSLDITFDGTVTTRAIAGAVPWATIYHDQRGNNAFVLRRWRARLGGKDGVPPAMAVQGERSKNTTLMLTPLAPGPLTLQPGDFVECDLFLLPYGPNGTEIPHATPQAEAGRYGTEAPRVVSVVRGTKRSDFPTRVDADGTGAAEFTVRGGRNRTVIIVGGLKTYSKPRLTVRDGATWKLVEHSHTGEDGYQVFVDERGKFGAVFLVDVGEGAEATYRAGAARP